MREFLTKHLTIHLIDMESIRRNLVLADMDVRTDGKGKRRIFSIKFVSGDGKLYFFPQAYACGAGKMNNKEFQLRGVQPCDCRGNAEGHPYPVNIDRIVEYNKMKVVL